MSVGLGHFFSRHVPFFCGPAFLPGFGLGCLLNPVSWGIELGLGSSVLGSRGLSLASGSPARSFLPRPLEATCDASVNTGLGAGVCAAPGVHARRTLTRAGTLVMAGRSSLRSVEPAVVCFSITATSVVRARHALQESQPKIEKGAFVL